MEGTLTRSLTNLPLARIEWRATFSQANSHTHTHTHFRVAAHTHTHLQVQNQKKGASENETPGPEGAYTTTHNNTPTQMPGQGSKLLTATFNQECSLCREESGV